MATKIEMYQRQVAISVAMGLGITLDAAVEGLAEHKDMIDARGCDDVPLPDTAERFPNADRSAAEAIVTAEVISSFTERRHRLTATEVGVVQVAVLDTIATLARRGMLTDRVMIGLGVASVLRWMPAGRPPPADVMCAGDEKLRQSRNVVYCRCRATDPGAEPFGALWVETWGAGDEDIKPGWADADLQPFDAAPGDRWADLPVVDTDQPNTQESRP